MMLGNKALLFGVGKKLYNALVRGKFTTSIEGPDYSQ